MFELSGVNYEEVLGDSILVRVIASSSYRGFELSGLYCIYMKTLIHQKKSILKNVNHFCAQIYHSLIRINMDVILLVSIVKSLILTRPFIAFLESLERRDVVCCFRRKCHFAFFPSAFETRSIINF